MRNRGSPATQIKYFFPFFVVTPRGSECFSREQTDRRGAHYTAASLAVIDRIVQCAHLRALQSGKAGIARRPSMVQIGNSQQPTILSDIEILMG